MARKIVIKLVGIVFMLGAIYLVLWGISSYSQQLDAENWIVGSATVTNVEQGYRSHGSRVKAYNITYEYHSNGESYIGEVIQTVEYRAVGDQIDIKYDPDSPEKSTNIMEPLPDTLILNIGGGIVFFLVGLWTIIRLPSKKSRSEKPRSAL